MAGRRTPSRTHRTRCPGSGESRRKGSFVAMSDLLARVGAVNRPTSALPGNLRLEVLSVGLADRGLDAPAVALADPLDPVAVSGFPHGFVALKAGAQPTRDR